MGIASSMRELTQDIASSREDRAKALLEIREEAQELVKGFQTSRKKEGAQLRKGLDQGAAERRSEVEDVLKGFQSQRKEAGGKLREELAQSRSSRESEVKELLKGAQDQIKELGRSRQETGKMLRKDLAKGRADRESEVNKFRAEVRADINEARAAWQELTRGKPARKPRVKMPPKVEALAEEEIPDLEAKLLAAIREHPQGITLAEVAASLGVAPIVLGRASRKLLDEGKIRREDRLYYLVSAEKEVAP